VDIVGVLMSSIVELAFIGAGTYGIVTTFLLRSQGNKSKVWPITEGIITSTRIDEREDKYNEYGPATLYYPEIN
jgi:glycerol-3-phosphate dehydrogenase